MMDGLKEILQDKFTDNQTVRENHSHGEDGMRGRVADAVVQADCLADVVKTVEYCRDHKLKLTAFGAGTSLEGHVVPLQGGVVLDLSAMNRIIDISTHNMTARIEAGVTRQQLNQELKNSGMFFSVDPGAQATIGGMAATGASGTNSVRYGTIKENVLSMQAVMANGALIETATGARKTSAGYDMTHLLIGSEGTLAIITELLVRLHPIPEHIMVLSCQFDDVHQAVSLVEDIMKMGMQMARLELVDAEQMRASIAYSDLQGYQAKPTILLEISGSQASVTEQAQMLSQLIDDHAGYNKKQATNEQQRRHLWHARHNAFYATRAFYTDPNMPNRQAIATDSCVPHDRLASALLTVRGAIAQTDLPTTMVAHMGDGNFHAQIMVNMDDEAEILAAKQLVGTISQIAIDHDGTCTGEHGIGMGKIDYLVKQHPDLIDWMKKIKQSFDPDNMLNPGKVFRY